MEFTFPAFVRASHDGDAANGGAPPTSFAPQKSLLQLVVEANGQLGRVPQRQLISRKEFQRQQRRYQRARWADEEGLPLSSSAEDDDDEEEEEKEGEHEAVADAGAGEDDGGVAIDPATLWQRRPASLTGWAPPQTLFQAWAAVAGAGRKGLAAAFERAHDVHCTAQPLAMAVKGRRSIDAASALLSSSRSLAASVVAWRLQVPLLTLTDLGLPGVVRVALARELTKGQHPRMAADLAVKAQELTALLLTAGGSSSGSHAARCEGSTLAGTAVEKLDTNAAHEADTATAAAGEAAVALRGLQVFALTPMLEGHHALLCGPHGAGKRTAALLTTGANVLALEAAHLQQQQQPQEEAAATRNRVKTEEEEVAVKKEARDEEEDEGAREWDRQRPRAVILVSAYADVMKAARWLRDVFGPEAFTPLTFPSRRASRDAGGEDRGVTLEPIYFPENATSAFPPASGAMPTASYSNDHAGSPTEEGAPLHPAGSLEALDPTASPTAQERAVQELLQLVQTGAGSSIPSPSEPAPPTGSVVAEELEKDKSHRDHRKEAHRRSRREDSDDDDYNDRKERHERHNRHRRRRSLRDDDESDAEGHHRRDADRKDRRRHRSHHRSRRSRERSSDRHSRHHHHRHRRDDEGHHRRHHREEDDDRKSRDRRRRREQERTGHRSASVSPSVSSADDSWDRHHRSHRRRRHDGDQAREQKVNETNDEKAERVDQRAGSHTTATHDAPFSPNALMEAIRASSSTAAAAAAADGQAPPPHAVSLPPPSPPAMPSLSMRHLRMRVPILITTAHAIQETIQQQSLAMAASSSSYSPLAQHQNSSAGGPPPMNPMTVGAAVSALPFERVRVFTVVEAERVVALPPLKDTLSRTHWIAMTNAVDVECQFLFTADRMGADVLEFLSSTLLPDVNYVDDAAAAALAATTATAPSPERDGTDSDGTAAAARRRQFLFAWEQADASVRAFTHVQVEMAPTEKPASDGLPPPPPRDDEAEDAEDAAARRRARGRAWQQEADRAKLLHAVHLIRWHFQTCEAANRVALSAVDAASGDEGRQNEEDGHWAGSRAERGRRLLTLGARVAPTVFVIASNRREQQLLVSELPPLLNEAIRQTEGADSSSVNTFVVSSSLASMSGEQQQRGRGGGARLFQAELDTLLPFPSARMVLVLTEMQLHDVKELRALRQRQRLLSELLLSDPSHARQQQQQQQRRQGRGEAWVGCPIDTLANTLLVNFTLPWALTRGSGGAGGPHAAAENVSTPTRSQSELVRACLDARARAVLGSTARLLTQQLSFLAASRPSSLAPSASPAPAGRATCVVLLADSERISRDAALWSAVTDGERAAVM